MKAVATSFKFSTINRMMEHTTHPNTPRRLGKRGVRVVTIVAVAIGLFGVFTGEVKSERESRLEKRLILETVPAGCRTRQSFVNKSVGEVIGANTTLSIEECEQLSLGLDEPEEYFTKITKTVQVERELPFYFDGRDWSAEIVSRGFRFVIGAGIGAMLALVTLTFFFRRKEVLAALSSAGGAVASSVGHIQNSLSNARGGTTMTASSIPPTPAGTPKVHRRTFFDIRFNRFVTPMILSIFYVICVFAACLFGFVFWLQTISDFSENGAGPAFITALWTAPLILLAVFLVCLLVRLIFESVMVIFRIADDLRKIRDK